MTIISARNLTRPQRQLLDAVRDEQVTYSPATKLWYLDGDAPSANDQDRFNELANMQLISRPTDSRKLAVTF